MIHWKTALFQVIDNLINIDYSCRRKLTNAFFRGSRTRRVRCNSSRKSLNWLSGAFAVGPVLAMISASRWYRKFTLPIRRIIETEVTECLLSNTCTASRLNTLVNVRRSRLLLD
jgi:hypothetical protein